MAAFRARIWTSQVRHRAILLLGSLLVAGFALAAFASSAGADHSVFERVSPKQSGTASSNEPIFLPVSHISADGSTIVLSSREQLLPEDTDSYGDFYAWRGGVLRLVSAGPQSTIDGPNLVGLSRDGSHIFFSTGASLSPADVDNGGLDFYEYSAGSVKLVSTGPADTGNPILLENDVHPTFASTPDGQHAFFLSKIPLVAEDTDSSYDIYERTGNTTTLITPGTPSNVEFTRTAVGYRGPPVSEDGAHVFFQSRDHLALGDTDTCSPGSFVGCYDVYEAVGGTYRLVSTGPLGDPALDATFAGGSPDGTRVFFQTAATLTMGDSDVYLDVYERSGGTTTLVSTGPADDQSANAWFAGVAHDSSRVFFESDGPFTADDTDYLNGCGLQRCQDVYERFNGTTTLISTGPTDPQSSFNNAIIGDNGRLKGMSQDGVHVFFYSYLRLTEDDLDNCIDVYERSGNTTTRITPGIGTGCSGAVFGANSADGSRVFFTSGQPLTPDDVDSGCIQYDDEGNPYSVPCVDVYERHAGTYTLLSKGPGGAGTSGAYQAFFGGASADGALVDFNTSAPLAYDDTNGANDVYSARIGFPPPTYEAPQVASALNVSLVPLFKQCGTPGNPSDSGHAPPLSVASCNPPAPFSQVARFGPGATGAASLAVAPGDPLTAANEADISLTANLTDIRTAGGLDYDPNPAGADLTGYARVRITDTRSCKPAPCGTPYDKAATTVDVYLTFPVNCTSTADTGTGSACNADTTANALAPGYAQEGRGTVVQSFRFLVDDSGQNGVRADSDDRIFATQGIFAP